MGYAKGLPKSLLESASQQHIGKSGHQFFYVVVGLQDNNRNL